jgi:hypothetical protein
MYAILHIAVACFLHLAGDMGRVVQTIRRRVGVRMSPPARLLILACSQRKRSESDRLPAIERYDGPPFRVLRRYLRSGDANQLDVCILSAEYGLISANQLIAYYDRKMTPGRARELNAAAISRLRQITMPGLYSQIMLSMGSTYLQAVDGWACIIPEGTTVRIAHGGLGRRLTLLRDWLYGEAIMTNSGAPDRADRGPLRIRGKAVAITPQQAIEIGRQGVETGSPGACRLQSWYVPIDQDRVAPKWLVSQLTGLPPSGFTTDEARRILNGLGIEVRRI